MATLWPVNPFGGDHTLVTVPAALVHACNALPALSWSYQMLHLGQDWVGALLAEMGPGFEFP